MGEVVLKNVHIFGNLVIIGCQSLLCCEQMRITVKVTASAQKLELRAEGSTFFPASERRLLKVKSARAGSSRKAAQPITQETFLLTGTLNCIIIMLMLHLHEPLHFISQQTLRRNNEALIKCAFKFHLEAVNVVYSGLQSCFPDSPRRFMTHL